MFRQYTFLLNKFTACFGSKSNFRNLHLGISSLNNIASALYSGVPNVEALPVLMNINFQNITNDEGCFLLKNCGTSTYNASRIRRNETCQNVFRNLVEHNKLDLSVYHMYIRVCTENRTLLNVENFLENLKCEPDQETLELLFKNVCECGDINQTFILLEIMKDKSIPADENIFTNLILVHAIKGGLEAAEKVFDTMKIAKVPVTSETYFAVLKGAARTKNYGDFKKFLDNYAINLDENQLLTLLKEMGLNQSVDWLPEMKKLFMNLMLTRDFTNNLEHVCIHLVHMNEADSALKIYNYFQQDPEGDNGFFILEEMIHANLAPEDVFSTIKYFCDNYKNEYVYEALSELALKNKDVGLALKLFENLSSLRPHFFWPLLINAKEIEGEAGIFRVIQQMKTMGVMLDSDTLEFYIIPFCSQDDVTSLVEKFKLVGLSVRLTLAPLLRVLLRNNEVEKAAELCRHYDVRVGGEKLFELICSSWTETRNPAIITVIQKYSHFANDGDDVVGDFLVSSLQSCTKRIHLEDFSKLLKHFYGTELKITTTSADILRKNIQKNSEGETEDELLEEILDGIDRILVFKSKTEKSYIPHPRQMTVDELECHLIELQEKGMEIRGVLRKLIHVHINLGNYDRAQTLRKQFLEAGYEESLGMKSALMYNFVKSGNMEEALRIYEELTKDGDFYIDTFKILDLATLLVKNDKIPEAKEILKAIELRNTDSPANVQRNCVQLLNELKDASEQEAVFNLLLDKGVCKLNNIMLGPLVRIHITRGELEKALDVFINFAEKYKFTPLQFELTKEIALSRKEELLQKILDVTTMVHGPLATQASLIGVLAELGEDKILRKLFATTKMPIKNDLRKRCDRWIKEGKVNAMITLANSCRNISKDLVDVDYIYECIIKTFALTNDCLAAVKFYENLLENEIDVDRRLQSELYKFLKQNNYTVPVSLDLYSKG